MRRKITILLLCALASLTAFAQLEVKPGSFKEVVGFVNIDLDKQTDDNDQPYAVVKVKTENINDKQRRELTFKGDARTFFEIEYRDGEVWLYISYYATYLKISHPDLSSTEFYFPFDMVGKKGYELTLVNKQTNAMGKGILTIKTTPELGATIIMNGSVLGQKTPYTNDMIAAGSYEITVSKDRYKNVTVNVDIQDGENRELEIDMPLDVAVITLKADDQTDVYIDGVFKKRGTWSGELYSGSHDITYKKLNYRDAEMTIVVEPEKLESYSLNMVMSMGEVNVTTEPSGAKVYIDGKVMGTAPIKKDISYGKHRISAYYGNKSAYKEIKVERGAGCYDVPLVLQQETMSSYAVTGYNMLTLNASMSQYNDVSYGLTIGRMRKFGWFVSAMTNFKFDTKSDYECDANQYVTIDGNSYCPEYTGNGSYTSLSVMGGFLMRLSGPVALRVGAGYGIRMQRYETVNGYWVKDLSTSAQGVDVSLGLQCNLRGFVISIDGVTTNFKTFEAKIGLGYGQKIK